MDASTGKEAKEEGEETGDERDDKSLDLKEGQVAENEGTPSEAKVELANVGGGGESSGEIHFYMTRAVRSYVGRRGKAETNLNCP